jgi:pyruvate dehydrogenase E2 component (dihydrolipoamide acetyltransferase)
MPIPVRAPRINNNDDFLKVSHLYVAPPSFVRQGDPLADLETDKATFTLEAERDGYVLRYTAEAGELVAVGSTLAWVGESAEDEIPAEVSRHGFQMAPANGHTPTLKAALLLAQYGLNAAEVAAAGARLTTADIERHLAERPIARVPAAASSASKILLPSEPGRRVELTGPERGMLHTVCWQREALPAYLEIAYDPRVWEDYAADFQKRHRLLMSPLLGLFAWRLARVALERPSINATLAGELKHIYDHVNLGFTVQAGPSLYAVVVRDAERMEMPEFVQKVGDLQRSAMRGALHPEEISGGTIGFSSMARWGVTRHVPVLLPHTALMVAHTAPADGKALLGATYDHRLLDGAAVFDVLQALGRPAGKESESHGKDPRTDPRENRRTGEPVRP